VQTQPVTARDSHCLHRHWYSWLYAYRAEAKPRPNSDIYALGIIGIQALTKMSPMQLQTRRPQYGELIWQHLVPVSPGLATVLNDGALPLQRPLPVSKETLQQVFTGYIPAQYPKTQQDTTVESLTPLPQTNIFGQNNVSIFPVNHSHPSKFNEWSGFGASSPSMVAGS